MSRRFLTALRSDRTGATIVEFALILPALMVTLMGLMDFAYNMYTAQMLQGAIQDAARDSTIDGAGGNEDAINARVAAAVMALAPGATPTFTRTSYASFSGVNRPEDYTDVNANDTCDDTEPFEDANGNGTWDLNPGTSGFGGARDAVLYTVSVNYRRLFPVFAFIPGQAETFTLSSSTVLRNQPYMLQANATPAVGACV